MPSKTINMVSYFKCALYLIFVLVDDQIVIDLVQKEIELIEAEKLSWIIQGFPRTKVQSLAL